MTIALVTGATSGIGLATAQELTRRGIHVALHCRDTAKGEAARRLIAREARADVELFVADLSSLAEVAAAAEDFARRHDRLDVLINNAGINPTQRSLTVDGLESTIAVNHLAPFLLTNLLADTLTAGRPARVITVASSVERVSRAVLDPADLQSTKDWTATRAYARSKQANILFTLALSRRLAPRGITANSLHPGIVGTNIFRDTPSLVRRLAQLILPGPDRGARTSVYMATSPEVASSTGTFYENSRPAQPSRTAQDPDLAEALWRASLDTIRQALPTLPLPALMTDTI